MPPGKNGAMSLHEFLTSLGLNPNFIVAGTAGGFCGRYPESNSKSAKSCSRRFAAHLQPLI